MSSPVASTLMFTVSEMSSVASFKLWKTSPGSEFWDLKLNDVGLSMEGDLAGTGNFLGRGGFEVILPLILGLLGSDSWGLLNGLGDLRMVEYLMFDAGIGTNASLEASTFSASIIW